MARVRPPAVVAALVAVGAVLGLVVANLVTPPRGASHHCPSGAPPVDCTYPGSQLKLDVGLVIVGMAIGLLVALSVVTVLNRVHQRRR